MRIATSIRTWAAVCGTRVRVAAACILLGTAVAALGAEIEPRAYVNTPVGVNFLLAGYAYSDGGLSTAASSPIKDAALKIHTGIVAYARALDIAGSSGKIDIIVPYSDLSGNAMVSGARRERAVAGFHDPRFRFSWNFYGAPALSVPEFATYQQDLLLGASLQVSPPLGQYDSDKLVNIGNNRWFVKPDLGISKAWGPFTVELSTGVTFFSRNDDFFGGKTLEEDPVSTSQLHITYNIARGVWCAVSTTFDYGGRTRLDGVRQDDLEKNSRAGVTLALPVTRRHSVKLYGSTDIHTSTGTNYDLVGVVWQYRWGRGL